MSIYESARVLDQFMEDLQVLYGLRAGHAVTQEDVDALNRLDAHWREEDERVCDAFHRGWTGGLTHAGGTDLAATEERLSLAQVEAVTFKALGKLKREFGFREGAQACREMMARFIEQGGDATTAASIRANWHPGWGDDPGAPEAIAVVAREPEGDPS